jgi:L-cysteine desulfidase
MTLRQAEIIEILHREVKPALGCTEPIAVALATAKATEILGNNSKNCVPDCPLWRQNSDFSVDVEVSGNILKNGMGVGIPGTDMVGLPIAAALGLVYGDSSLGLEVLRGVNKDAVEAAKDMVKKGRVNVRVAEDSPLLYVKAGVSLDKDYATATIADDHDNIVETSFNGKILSGANDADDGNNGENSDYKLSVKEIFDFTNTVSYEEIKFILEGRDYNWKLSQEGLEHNYGLSVGKTIRENQNSVFGDDFMSYAMGVTAAASDARMAGSTLAAMSNSGSGNQGITVSMPVIAYAKRFDVDDERLARALVLSNLVAIHIKTYLGKLSALCGCVVASTGSACGIVWLEGGNYEQVCAAIKNMVGNITGMVCDGAKVGCAMKVASGVYSSVQSAVLALNGICADENNGIIDRDIEKTIKNLGEIGSVGMKATDEMILKIMSCK